VLTYIRIAGADDVFAASNVVRNGVSGMIAPGRRIVHAPLRLPRIETRYYSWLILIINYSTGISQPLWALL
jgi:hypothetical protein